MTASQMLSMRLIMILSWKGETHTHRCQVEVEPREGERRGDEEEGHSCILPTLGQKEKEKVLSWRTWMVEGSPSSAGNPSRVSSLAVLREALLSSSKFFCAEEPPAGEEYQRYNTQTQ